MINITFDNFDKAFWVSPTNMRNLMKAAIDIDINIGKVEDVQVDLKNDIMNNSVAIRDLDQLMQQVNDALRDISGGTESDAINALSARVASCETKIGILERQNQANLNIALQAVQEVNDRIDALEANWQILARTLVDTVKVVNEHTQQISDIDKRLSAGGL